MSGMGVAGRARGRSRWRWAGLSLCALMLCLAGLATLAAPVDSASEVTDPLNMRRWISRMWEPVAVAGGPLTDERRDDVVLVLHRRDAIPNDRVLPVGSRGLAIFSLDADGNYRRVALFEGLLPCVQCMGTVSRDPRGAPFEIDIAERQLTVSWIGNADGFVYVRLVIAWDPHEQAFGLMSDEVVRADRLSGIKSRRTRDYRAGRAVTDGRVTEFPSHFIPAERIQADDYR